MRHLTGISRRTFLGQVSSASGGIIAAKIAPQARLEIVVPADGGTPRDPARIARIAGNEFRIAAAVEEESSPLTHAVSRVDFIVRNAGAATEAILHIDLSGGGSRSNFDTSIFGGMPKRNYVYVQRPGDTWRRVDGTTTQWVATVRFSVPPGGTKVGLSPWYTYADYLAFIRSLPAHPHLKRAIIGRSDGGREHWELTITDPAVPPEKKPIIFWHAREHAYETYSSLAIEGLVALLLSPAAAGYRRRFRIAIHPMTNVDGVANGYEYRAGYDHPEPRGTASGRLTFSAMDRLRPQFAVAWHNWIAPRDVDVVFFTDGEDGKPVRRAWDLLTQRFPSPRAVGHRWDSEHDPNEKNWFGRELSDTNVHQYAMKHYGTYVWGWEMPWWERDEGDPLALARRAGANFGRAFLDTITGLESPPPMPPESPIIDLPCREMHEFEVRGKAHVENPYRDASLIGHFSSPSGKLVMAEGFHCGGDLWKMRIVLEEEGEWRYLLRGEGAELFAHGRIRASAPRARGFIRVHPENPYAFAYSDRTAFFPMGDTCYGLHDDSPVTPELRSEYLNTRRRQRFNFVRMSIGHSAPRASADARFWAWGGTADQPDLDRLNPRFFESLDAVMREMQACGMNAELLLFNYYRRPFTEPAQWTPSRERLWLRYVIARYSAFTNLFLWTLSNEYETHPDGAYRLDKPADVEWAKEIGRTVHQLDPYRHPYTVHPVVSSSTGGATPRDPYDPPWRIGGFFGSGSEVDVLSQQTSVPYQRKWDESLRCWTGDAAGVETSIAADRVYDKPVLNTENGYEYLPGYPTNRNQVYHTDTVRRAAWRIVCAGGYFSAGFISTLAHGDAWDVIDRPNRHPFLVRDAGAAAQLASLFTFFEALPFWRMHPAPEVVRGDGLCLGAAAEVFVVYLPRGGNLALNLTPADHAWSARWFNPRNGKLEQGAHLQPLEQISSPDADDWVLLVRRSG
jgi:hypothetical protein